MKKPKSRSYDMCVIPENLEREREREREDSFSRIKFCVSKTESLKSKLKDIGAIAVGLSLFLCEVNAMDDLPEPGALPFEVKRQEEAVKAKRALIAAEEARSEYKCQKDFCCCFWPSVWKGVDWLKLVKLFGEVVSGIGALFICTGTGTWGNGISLHDCESIEALHIPNCSNGTFSEVYANYEINCQQLADSINRSCTRTVEPYTDVSRGTFEQIGFGLLCLGTCCRVVEKVAKNKQSQSLTQETKTTKTDETVEQPKMTKQQEDELNSILGDD